MQTRACVLIFVKAPYPGAVKSRLGKDIGMDQAAALYQCFTQDVLAIVQHLAVDGTICYAPAHAYDEVYRWLGPLWNYRPQEGDTLGERMAQAFEQAFELGYQQVLILGSDSPDLPLSYLQEGLLALAAQQVVIGPSRDGGYYTLGFTPESFLTAVFQNIPWSTATVYAQTLAILQAYGRSVHSLPLWDDIDTLQDLQRFYRRQVPQAHPSDTLQYLHQLPLKFQHGSS